MKKLTHGQIEFMKYANHLEIVSRLDDGDCLVVDKGDPGDLTWNNGHYGPYILTIDGLLQDVNYHYSKYHLVNCPCSLVP